MAQWSSGDGPPPSMTMLQLTSFLELSMAPSAFRPNNWLSPSPRNESDPACRKSRRRKPSQNSTGLSASRRNMAAVLLRNGKSAQDFTELEQLEQMRRRSCIEVYIR